MSVIHGLCFRKDSLEEALDTVSVALEYPEYVVGIDFSGNPNVNQFSDFRQAFEKAKDSGLKLAIHVAEIFNEKDTRDVLQFGVDRLGHACCLVSACVVLCCVCVCVCVYGWTVHFTETHTCT